MKTLLNIFLHFEIILIITIILLSNISCQKKQPDTIPKMQKSETQPQKTLQKLIYTFLGNEKRKFYGVGLVPQNPSVIWKVKIGGDSTKVGKKMSNGLLQDRRGRHYLQATVQKNI